MLTGHVFIATSLDGYIARPNGALDWLMESTRPGEDNGFERFMAHMDGIVMGSGTYRAVLGFEAWPYDKPVVVMSRRLGNDGVPGHLRGRVEITGEEPRAVFRRLSNAGWRRAYVDGGAVIRSFLREDLIVELTVTRAPVLIGKGLPLFGAIGRDVRLVHEETQAFASGLVQSRYRVSRREPPVA